MPLFLHLTQEKNIGNIKKNGIKGKKVNEDIPCGVFCMPVTQDYYFSHQWIREMKRWAKGKNITGVYFRIKSGEEVWCGHYNNEHVKITAGQSVKLAMENKISEGWEVIFPGKVETKNIIKYRQLPQIVGWRYFPGSHGRKLCLCPACIRDGDFKSVKMRIARYNELMGKLRSSDNEQEITDILYDMEDMILWSKGKIKNVKDISFLMNHPSEKVVKKVISTMSSYKTEEAFAFVLSLLESENPEIKKAAGENILWLKKEKGIQYLEKFRDNEDIRVLIEEYKDIYSS